MLASDCFRRRFSSCQLIPIECVLVASRSPREIECSTSAGFGDDFDDLDIKLKGISISFEFFFYKLFILSNFFAIVKWCNLLNTITLYPPSALSVFTSRIKVTRQYERQYERTHGEACLSRQKTALHALRPLKDCSRTRSVRWYYS
jgi:hypothetical protein